ncbi:MAG TPA: serine/threonine-protein kinase [Kofleriaceae bacterium]|nr:serine/threonine-protein kinase [Kofleriaceae bacterium]
MSSRDEDQATQLSSPRLPQQPPARVSRDSLHEVETSITPQNPRRRMSTPSLGPKGSSLGGSNATTVGSPLEALEADEIMRTRLFCIIGMLIGAGGGASALVLHGDPMITKLLLVAVIVALGGCLFLWLRTRDPIAFRRSSTQLGWFIPAACVTTSIPYYGSFSPAAVVLVLGVYFTGLGKNSKLSYAVYAVCAGMQLLVGVLVIAGARDTGIINVERLGLSTAEELILQGLVQMVFLATIVTARVSRRTALIAVGELERAVRIAAHREALLLEAREELERALRQGRGRFSDQTIGGYHLGQLLGRGAMGEVYEAEGAAGRVAVKLLSQASLSNPNHVLRFLRELRTAANVRSPNIVQVIDVGEHPVPYLVMERLEGQTLAEIMRARGRPLGAQEGVDLVAQIGNGITAAAIAGIVHRDLKPQNVFLDRGTWKILDFGVARAMDQGDTLTAGQVVGTPSYMAPEQATGGAVDHRTDLYALAAIAYRALTGQPPYAAGEVAETLYKVVHTKPRRPSELVDLPPEIDLVLAIGMAKNPEHRFASATELAAALAAAFAGALPEHVFERGRVLERMGVWSSRAPTRASTSNMRAARPPR